MIKLAYCLTRRAEIDRAAFQHYWLHTHAPLVAAAAAALGCRRYVQSHTLDSPLTEALVGSRGAEPQGYDGIAELWWDSLEALAAASATEEGARHGALLLADEANFIDFARSRIFLVREHVIVGSPTPY